MLVFVLGIVPGAILAYLAGVLLSFSIGSGSAVLESAWALLGIAGYFTFWAVLIGPNIEDLSKKTRVIYVILLSGGILAALPLVLTNLLFILLAGLPVIAAVRVIFVIASTLPEEK